eukprot:CAMPEP_0117010786 /NCGR_PEP_ID=MMETSP0472-20121206/9418_1 /TAXON_ID=693140 ORGANISM="Tiarina fusus, Strain LIS" /NCGR_SAMPLE_ID=MMETSP0472 /ASSEMBLY_ACC=CAM_ASM_000603 /LENGTH=385 /DNA_ID=CAMNT_0004713407 /DNA_START=236 /DNA_END=1393 /DNA_ORIENTATION=+
MTVADQPTNIAEQGKSKKMDRDEEAQAQPIPEEEKRAPMPPGTESVKGPPPPASKKKKKSAKKAPPREKNPKFKDLEETGAWGSMSTTEMYVGMVILAILLIGGGVAIALVVTGGEDPEPQIVAAPPRPTEAPTAAPTDVLPDSIVANVLQGIQDNPATASVANGLPVTAVAYQGLRDSPTASAQEKAMSWLLFDDEWEISAHALARWSMASIYYQLGGMNWTSQENWLSSESVCDWEGAKCEPISGSLREIDLFKNGLVGTIPVEFALLTSLQSLLLTENELSGTIPGAALGSLPNLSILYLDSNKLNGTVPVALADNGALNTLFVQFNMLTGIWPFPTEACPSGTMEPLDRFGLDCDRVSCSFGCCDSYNCYRRSDAPTDSRY